MSREGPIGHRVVRMDRARKNQDTYDRVAAQYLERGRDRSLLRPLMLRFRDQLPVNGLVLDLGAGPCLVSAELRSLGLRVISLDRSRQMLLSAQQEVSGPRVQADMRHLTFHANCFAGVWACASLLHLDRDELIPALSGICNVLVPSGVLFMSLKCGSGGMWESAKFGPDAPRWFTYWSDEDVDWALRSAGFEVVESATEDVSQVRWMARIARRSEAA
jgi:SAM-dependent methyltransferase